MGTGYVAILLASRYGSDCRDRVQPPLADWYDTTTDVMWGHMQTLTQSSAARPLLEVVHSPHSLPELIATAGDSLLVYDQHLGQVFTRLTKLTITGASPLAVDAYLSKLAAVRLLSRGRYDSASSLAIASILLKEEANDPIDQGSPTERSVRHVLAQGQEAFVLGHELAHHLKFRDPDSFASFEEDVVNILGQWNVHWQTSAQPREAVIEDLTRSAAAAWERRHGPLAQEQVDQLRQLFAADTPEDPATESAGDTFAAFMTDQDLREETTCDVLAGMVAVPTLIRGGDSPTEAIQAVAYAMHHLRLIQTVHSVTDGGVGDLKPGLRTSMMRLTLLRACLGVFLEVVFGGELLTSDLCHDVMTAVNLLHSKVVGDQLWTMTSRSLRELLAAPATPPPSVDALRLVLGFGPGPEASAGVP